MNSLKQFIPLLLVAVLIGATSLMFFQDVSALTLDDGVNASRGNGIPSQLLGGDGFVSKVTNTLLFIVGALSVIMLIVGGFRYVISGGNSTAVTAAKNTVLYAIVGLVISFLAYAAITFIIGTLAPGTGTGGGGTNI